MKPFYSDPSLIMNSFALIRWALWNIYNRYDIKSLDILILYKIYAKVRSGSNLAQGFILYLKFNDYFFLQKDMERAAQVHHYIALIVCEILYTWSSTSCTDCAAYAA